MFIYVHMVDCCSGTFLLDILWSDKQVHGSPFKVKVTPGQPKASKVICSTEGLVRGGALGQDLVSIIDTRQAGSGRGRSLGLGLVSIIDTRQAGSGIHSHFHSHPLFR